MWMRHVDRPERPPVSVARSAFDRIWQGRGWAEVDEPRPQARRTTAPLPVDAAPQSPAEPLTEPDQQTTQDARPTRARRSKENTP